VRRNEREITDPGTLESILKSARVLRLGLSDGDQPYVVPLNFGYRDQALYIHSARQGRKLDIIKKNNRVCFEADVDHEIVEAERACDWTMKYRSVVGFGIASLVEDLPGKREALEVIMGQYSDRSFTFEDKIVEKTAIIKVEIESMSGKQSGR
jgi:nitroimidazol reductase NimA-like FMN-containing flavoprotein (pyridoxamine 5'-phosphate oxidase superfamily)